VAFWRRARRKDGYKPSLRSTDILNPDRLYIGSKRHVQIVDLLSCVWSEQDEDLVRLLGHGWSQQEVAREFGVSQQTISQWIRELRSHAERT
jgi:DNA-directed RNA polymerase specialized sigma24 family protein